MTDPAARTPTTYTQELQRVETKLDAILAALHATPAPPPTPTPAPPAPPTTIQAVYWVNESLDLPQADAVAIVTALNAQAADLDTKYPGSQAVAHTLWTGDPARIPTAAWPMYWLPDADTAGALGYHDVDPTGRPYGRVFTRYQGKPWPTLRPGPDGISISNISSHEAVEIQVDPGCAATATAPNGDVWALEAADPVEAYSYDLTTPGGAVVSMSDYVTAAFFGHGTGGFDALGRLSAPFTIAPGGYAIINGRQVFDDRPSLRFLSQQGSPAGRTARRVAGTRR